MGLFKPAWQISNYEKRLKAVKKLNNQKELAEVAMKEVTDNAVRSEAFRKLTDQALLADVSINAVNERACWTAFGKLTDLISFETVAQNSRIVDMRVKAVDKVTNQGILANIAKKDKDKWVRSAAVRNLTDQALLYDIFSNDNDSLVRTAAISTLTDQSLLANIALNNHDKNSRRIATSKLNDQAVLTEIAKNDKDEPVIIEALKMISDKAVIADLAKNATSETTRINALANLDDLAILADIAKNDKSKNIREKAKTRITNKKSFLYRTKIEEAEKLTDFAAAQEAYADIAKNSPDDYVRIRAAEKLTDKALEQNVFADIVKCGTNLETRITAAKKLTNQDLINEVFAGVARQRVAAIGHIHDRDREERQSKDLHTEAVRVLTDQEVLMEIANSNDETMFTYTWDDGHMGDYKWEPYYMTVDIRDIACDRLSELNNVKYVPNRPPQEKEANNTGDNKDKRDVSLAEKADSERVKETAPANYNELPAPGQILNDFAVILQSLKNSQRVWLKGIFDGALIMTPENVQMAQELPKNSNCMYQILSLNHGWTGDVVFSLNTSSNPHENLNLGDIVPHYGFPNLCLKCRKPVEVFTLLMALVDNKRTLRRVSIDSENAQEIYKILKNYRHFWAIPTCRSHTPLNNLYVSGSVLYTDDKDIINNLMMYGPTRNPHMSTPVKVVSGRVIYS